MGDGFNKILTSNNSMGWMTFIGFKFKNTDYMKKSFKSKLLRIQFLTKNSVGAHVYFPPGVELWGSKYCHV